jgi:hypothetical protein
LNCEKEKYMIRKSVILSGVVSTFVYCVAVIVGGIIRPGYSHVSQFVSELIATGAPNKSLLDPVFALYNILTAVFAWTVFSVVRTKKGNTKRTIGVLGALTLLAEGVFGLATLFFPQDRVGTPLTTRGTMHIMLAGLSSLTTMVAILLMGMWFRAETQLKPYGIYSFLSVAFVFIFGGMAAAMGANQSPISGLMERLTIGGFLQWMAVISIGVFLRLRTTAQ